MSRNSASSAASSITYSHYQFEKSLRRDRQHRSVSPRTGRELSCGEDTNLFVDEAVCSSELFRCASRRNNQSEARGPFRRREASAEQLFSRPLYSANILRSV